MAPDDIESQVARFVTTRVVIVTPAVNLSLLWFVYGIYVVVFGLSVHALTKRRNTSAPRLYLWCTIALFAFDTLIVGINAVFVTYQAAADFAAAKTRDWYSFRYGYLAHDTVKTVSVAINLVVSNFMNIVADCMLIHRCYIVWDFEKSVLYPLAALSFALNGMIFGANIPGVIAVSNTGNPANHEIAVKHQVLNADVWMAVAGFNFLLTMLTGRSLMLQFRRLLIEKRIPTPAGRIWWISSQARRLMGRGIGPRYKAIVYIIVESGFLYTATLLGYTLLSALLDPGAEGRNPIDLLLISTQMSGLAPTLIIVRVTYNKAIQSVQQVVSNLQFQEPGTQQSVSERETIDLRPSRFADNEPGKAV